MNVMNAFESNSIGIVLRGMERTAFHLLPFDNELRCGIISIILGLPAEFMSWQTVSSSHLLQPWAWAQLQVQEYCTQKSSSPCRYLPRESSLRRNSLRNY